MPRRKKSKTTIPLSLLVRLAVVLIVLGLAANLLSNISSGDVDAALIGVLVIGGLWWLWARHLPGKGLLEKTERAIAENLNVLIKRRAQLIQHDAYGTQNTDRWNKEIHHFLTSQIAGKLNARERVLFVRRRPAISQSIEARVAQAQITNPAFSTFSTDMKPAEFEHHCAEELKKIGWDARVTMASRDQGVDVVAQKNGVRLVLQCKLYNQPVGNKAVQEVVAAKNHEQAHFAAVVTNADYTEPARQLANTNKVWLLHYSDLQMMDALVDRARNIKP